VHAAWHLSILLTKHTDAAEAAAAADNDDDAGAVF